MLYGILPLDSRPINTTQLQLFCTEHGINAQFFPFSALGTQYSPADFHAIISWIHSTNCDEYILSVNALCCGGLVQSRNLSSAHIRNASLLGELFVGVNVRLGLVLPRIAPTVTCSDMINQHKDASLREADIPADVVRLQLWSLFLQQLPSLECIVQEDTCRNSKSTVAMLELVQKYQPQYSYYANGGDELLYLMLAKSASSNPNPAARIVFAFPEFRESVLKFEHIELCENVSRCAKYLDVHLKSEESDCPNTFFINNSPVLDADLIEGSQDFNQILASNLVDAIQSHVKSNLFVADVANANGGNEALWHAFRYTKPHLTAYSAWNTPMNAIGTLLATLKMSINRQSVNGNNWFLMRILDDYIYQSKVRGKLIKIANDLHFDSWNLSDAALNQLLPLSESMMLEEYINLRRALPCIPTITSIKTRFPWHRLFEIEINHTIAKN